MRAVTKLYFVERRGISVLHQNPDVLFDISLTDVIGNISVWWLRRG